MLTKTRFFLTILMVIAASSALNTRTFAADNSKPSNPYLIQPGDVLAVSVWREEELTQDVIVRPDGQISTPNPAPQYELKAHPEFTNMLQIQPTGENRMAYLHVKPGKMDGVRQYIDTTWPDQFFVVETEQVLESGLYGHGKQHPQLLDRLGDLVVHSRGDAYLWWAEKENPLRGRHGGLSVEEMLVPLLTSRI